MSTSLGAKTVQGAAIWIASNITCSCIHVSPAAVTPPHISFLCYTWVTSPELAEAVTIWHALTFSRDNGHR
ncbi:hypothetical protein ZWY2020_033519 [Hordeum vulgare]|nr:hypothetical protein ZWY2020_033519 [Hordeum vulgare]